MMFNNNLPLELINLIAEYLDNTCCQLNIYHLSKYHENKIKISKLSIHSKKKIIIMIY